MNENTRTITFVAVAVVVALIAWIGRPTLRVTELDDIVGRVLFEKFNDPLEAASLEIIEYDEETGTPHAFKVAQVDQQWSIPSHEDYPADAENQLADVAASLIGLKVLDMASDSPGDHQLFGVVDPDPQKLQPGDTGVGTRVEMRNKSDEVLLSLIIGKEVPDNEGLRYVREVGRDPVYTVPLKTDKLSTKFEDWIEDDLLKLNTWDVRQVHMDDYSVDVLAGVRTPRSRMTLEYDDGDSKWKLNEDKVFKDGKYVDVEMAEDEELNTSKLNDMKWALDDLKIVDVHRKPKGLSETLKGTGPMKLAMEDVQSLATRGFYISQNQLLSSEGEISVLMKDGAEYVLRFGQIAGTGSDEPGETDEEKEEPKDAAEQKEGDEEAEDESEGDGLNRYLFVMVQFNPDAIEKPELEPLPGPKEEAGNGEASDAETAESKTSGEDAPETEASEEKAPEDEASQDEISSDEASKEGEADEAMDDEKGEIEKERIEKENKRKQEEYDEKVQKGRDHVQELNERFADWYYVISDEVYQKVHLSRDDVVKKKEKEEDADKDEGDKAESVDQSAEAAEGKAEQTGKAEPAEEAPEKPEAKAGPEAAEKSEAKTDAEAAEKPEAKAEQEVPETPEPKTEQEAPEQPEAEGTPPPKAPSQPGAS